VWGRRDDYTRLISLETFKIKNRRDYMKARIMQMALIVSLAVIFPFSSSHALDLFGKDKNANSEKAAKTEKKIDLEGLTNRIESIKTKFTDASEKMTDANNETADLIGGFESKQEFAKRIKEAYAITDTADKWEKIDALNAKLNEMLNAEGTKAKLKAALSDAPHIKSAKAVQGHLSEALKHDKAILEEAKLLLQDVKTAIASFSVTEAIKQREKISPLKDASSSILPHIIEKAPKQIEGMGKLVAMYTDVLKTSKTSK
jgi:hypothetical protein